MYEQEERMLQFFAFDQGRSDRLMREAFETLAKALALLPRNSERTVALRKLLEARDAAIRASVAR